MNLLGIITARAHSTRIPHKNLKKIKNKCLVEITMDFVKKINYLSDAVITTDSKKIISSNILPYYHLNHICLHRHQI